VLIDRCLVAGGFFSEEALAKVTEGVIARLEAASPLKPGPVAQTGLSRPAKGVLVPD
jgi:capsular polysaccharide export protein